MAELQSLGAFKMPLLDANLLITDIASDDEERRRKAKDIISEIDHDTDVDVSVFVSFLSSKNDDIVFWCEIALEHLGERGHTAITQLIALLKREQLFLRQSAVKALASVGPRDASSRAAIFGSFQDSSPFVRREALQACIGIPNLTTEELGRIASMAADPDEAVSSWSETALRNIRLNAKARA